MTVESIENPLRLEERCLFNNPQTRRVHGVDLPEYYTAAIATMINKNEC
ncbi:MAG: hypothetical protein KatS3mg067_0643 [Thermosynechococcus sp.]|nr:MAG: hypothetical protein KatS3mg067_0643 [Thermosynechococcus sp.]